MGTVWRCAARSPTMDDHPYVPLVSNCTIDSLRSPIRWRASRKKGGASSCLERVATPADARTEENGAGVACARKGVCPRPPGGTCPGQSRRGQQPGRARALPGRAADDARTASIARATESSHQHVFEGDHELLAWLIQLLR